MRPTFAVTLAALVLGTCACGGGAAASTAGGPPAIDPNKFVRVVDNPWFPLRTGSVWRYRGVKDRSPSTDVVRVTGATKVIQGVTATAVSDRLYERGRLEEKTTDWYTQDRAGNVWYFGEATEELNRNGKVKSTEGSWEAGVDGARPGIFMTAHPRPGQTHRQEFYKGHAEDHFRVLRLHATVGSRYARPHAALLTKEWTPLEPGVIDHKFYTRGIGTVLEETVKGGVERNLLVSFKRGS